MPKRRADADTRRFFDEFESVRVSRFRADGTIDPQKQLAVIKFPSGATKLIGTSHTWFARGGGWSWFLCPKCARRTPKLYLVEERPLCTRCCDALNIKHVSHMGFGREARRKAQDRHLDKLIAKIEATESPRLKPAPAVWGKRAQICYGSRRMAETIRRRLIQLRLHALASQQASARAGENDSLVNYRPIAEASALIDLRPIWQANTSETLAQALDAAQVTIINALESSDPQQRLYAAKLMLRTKQARDRGL
jgi:hypothetical protein